MLFPVLVLWQPQSRQPQHLTRNLKLSSHNGSYYFATSLTSYYFKLQGLELDLRDRKDEVDALVPRLSAVAGLPSASNIASQLASLNESISSAIDALAAPEIQ